ncbi:patatin-domain-containing protein [Ophiobolus disseminans]|uniref:Patatin-like phospholipase domain-containing protein n=1 Tax=Ophiobolus disseminans TaxID=1469910 RepID=A0A6A6ZR70_9PLEO|nr:patatin-domain-containing protein [Ophiobolus disseminans]
MSFLSDTLFSVGSARLHSGGPRNGPRVIRKSRSDGRLLGSLVQLVRDPVGTLNNAVSSKPSVAGTDATGRDAQRRQILYQRLQDAETYNEWKDAAAELDACEGNDPWKEEDDSDEYDAALVATRLKELDEARMSCDVNRMHFHLRTALTRDLGGMGDLSLYKHSHIGTKKLIERYIESLEKTLAALLDVSAKQGDQCPFTPRRLVDQIKHTRQSFGRSALLLSGGGTFGMNHIGVVKCLWDTRLLPRIISGASAGSIVAAVLCSKIDEEIPAVMHEFCNGDLDVFEKFGESEGYLSKVVRMFQTGGLFDISHLSRVMQGLLGDMTFQEAYFRTQRILNIPVSTSSHFELPRLLNYLTAPNVVIWSAVCTSCSVPLVYKKATLLAKDPTRGLVPWDPNPDATWIDGSVDNDLPMTRLAEMWNVNHFIVSQVNPHVIPFLEKDAGMNTASQSMTSSITHDRLMTSLSLARGELIHRMQVLVDMGILPSIVTKLRSVLSQRYSGDINIFPHISLVDFPRVLSNPTPEYMVGCMLAGQRATWPKLSRIQNHVSIELALDAAVHELEGRAMIADMEQDRINNQGRPASADNNLSHARRSKSSHKITRFDTTEPSSPLQRKSAPTSPFLHRATLRTPTHFIAAPIEQAAANSSRKRTEGPDFKPIHTPLFQIMSPTNEDSSDRDYFAEVDSDTTDHTSSPITSPASHDPSASDHVPFQSSSQTSTLLHPALSTSPTVSTSSDRRTGEILNLTMTPASPPKAGPSSAELRYKKLFHPPASTEPDASAGASVAPMPTTSSGSRRSSAQAS